MTRVQRSTFIREHPDTHLTMNNLASTLDSRGPSNKAVALLAPALELSKRIFGPRHPRTRLHSENLLIMYRKLGWSDKGDALEASLLPSIESFDFNLHADLLHSG